MILDFSKFGKEIVTTWKDFYIIERPWNAAHQRFQAINIDGHSLGFFRKEKDAKDRINAYEKNGW